MRDTSRQVRAWLRAADGWYLYIIAALLSAALADYIVESAVNLGLLTSVYSDHHQENIPLTIAVGACVFAAVVVTRVVSALSARGPASRDWLVEAAEAISVLPFRRVFGRIFGLQLAVLLVMESSEQALVAGHLLGGLTWLGGPSVLAVLVHACTCLLMTLTLASIARRIAAACVRLSRALMAVIQFFRRLPRNSRAHLANEFVCVLVGSQSPCRGQLGERPPPFVSA